MDILTDKKDGDAALEPFLSELNGEWELICKGEASPSFMAQWDCEFSLQRSPKRNLFALLLVDYGDASSRDEDEDFDPSVKVVAVWLDPPVQDESAIACALLNRYRRDGGRYIDGYIEIGRFNLDAHE